MDRQTGIDLDNAIIDAFRWSMKDEEFLTTRQLIDKNPHIQAVLYRAHHPGVYYMSEREEDFLDYRIRRLLETENGVVDGLFRSMPTNIPFTITQEWVGPFTINGWREKKKLRAWVKRERSMDKLMRERREKAIETAVRTVQQQQ